MKIGQPVQGLLTQNWRFVEDDLYGIADRVIEYDSDARLGIHIDGRLGILRFAKTEVTPGGAWIVAFNLDDPLSLDGYWYGEPDSRVIEQMGRADLHKRDPIDAARKLKALLQLEEFRREVEAREEREEVSEQFLHRYRKAEGQKRKIFT
jgi:hypothetical protein